MDGGQVAQERGEQVPEPRAVSLSPVIRWRGWPETDHGSDD